MPSNFGPFNYRCEIYKPIETRDADYNSIVTTWQRVGSFYCSVSDILPKNDENTNEQRVFISPQRSKLRIRFTNTEIAANMRVIIVRQGVKRIYNIVSEPAELGLRDGLEMQIEHIKPTDSEVMTFG